MSVFTREGKTNIPSKGPSPHPTMPQIKVSRGGIKKLLSKVKPKKASGPDRFPARFLMEMAEPLSTVLAFIFQQSLDQGQVPQDWRDANVAPIFKKGDRGQAANYRPVSLTAIPCKILEHVIVSQTLDHLDAHHILVDCQHGFRAKRSCETQLIITAHDLASSLNRHKQIDMAVLDFSKAFDRVPHQRLLLKLEYYGMSTSTVSWIKSFLDSRTQQVIVDGESSKPGPVHSGVPQGTVLGPMLFLLYINDITEDISSSIRLFADDCLVYKEITSPEDSKTLQEDLDKLVHWGNTWLMSFNVKKCHVMRLTSARKHITPFDYFMNGEQVHLTQETPYLGVIITSKLSWNEHINHITSKAQRMLGFLRRNLHSCPRQIREQSYMSLVRPTLEYCASVWDPQTVKGITKVENVQRRAARYICPKSAIPALQPCMIASHGW